MIELDENEIAQAVADWLADQGIIRSDGKTPVRIEFEKRDGGQIWAQVWTLPKEKDKP